MNERELRRLERQSEIHREWRRECAGYSEAGEAGEAESAEAAAPSDLLECCCCEHRGPRGEVEAQLEDGEQGLYVLLCVDQQACLWRYRELMRRWHAEQDPQAPLVVYDDTAEFPF